MNTYKFLAERIKEKLIKVQASQPDDVFLFLDHACAIVVSSPRPLYIDLYILHLAVDNTCGKHAPYRSEKSQELPSPWR